MITTSARLLKLLSLLQTPRDWTGPQLAQRLEVSTRTVRSDIDRLRELGYPVDGQPGVSGGYRLRPGSELPPLLLDDDEAVAVALGLHASATGSLAGAEEISLRALTKITQLLPSRLRRRVQTLQGVSTMLPTGAPRVPVDLLQSIAQACRDHEGLRFDYRRTDWETGHQVTTRRRAEPHELVHRGSRWYLLAFDNDATDWRTFRLDRIRLRSPGGARFQPREIPGGDAGAFVSDRITAYATSHQATVRLHAPIGQLEQWFNPAWGRLEADVSDPDCSIFHPRNESWAAIVFSLTMSDLEFDVIEPTELADYVEELSGRLQRSLRRPAASAAAPRGRSPGT